MSDFIDYPEPLFTVLRLEGLLMRLEVLDVAKDKSARMTPAMLNLFLQLGVLDAQIVAAQKARGYSDLSVLQEIGRLARERKAQGLKAHPITSQTPKYICYPEALFTSLRIQLMSMRGEILDAETESQKSVPQDMANIFSALCMLDNYVIEAQQARGYSDATTQKQLQRVRRNDAELK